MIFDDDDLGDERTQAAWEKRRQIAIYRAIENGEQIEEEDDEE